MKEDEGGGGVSKGSGEREVKSVGFMSIYIEFSILKIDFRAPLQNVTRPNPFCLPCSLESYATDRRGLVSGGPRRFCSKILVV